MAEPVAPVTAIEQGLVSLGWQGDPADWLGFEGRPGDWRDLLGDVVSIAYREAADRLDEQGGVGLLRSWAAALDQARDDRRAAERMAVLEGLRRWAEGAG